MADKNILKAVIQGIRGRIISGMWPPGTHLPTRNELAAMLNTSPATVQMAIHALVVEGSIVTRKRAGTFIAEHPPELGRFALVIAKPVGAHRFMINLFHAALIRAMTCVAQRQPGWKMEFWYTDDERLNALIRSNAMAGVLYFGPPQSNPAAGLPLIPSATFYYPGHPIIEGLNIILDNIKLLDCGIQALRRRNYTRISVLTSGGLMPPGVDSQPLGSRVHHLAEKIRAAGGAFRPEWIQHPELQNDPATYQLTRLLFGNPQHRPQAVILMDDHLLSPVREALNDLELRMPQDVAVCTLSHARPESADDPTIYIGFDTEDFMMNVVTRLSLMRLEKPGPVMFDVEFEELMYRPLA